MGCSASTAHYPLSSTSQVSLDSKASSPTTSHLLGPDHVLWKRDEEEVVGSQTFADQGTNRWLRAEKPLVAELKVLSARGLPAVYPSGKIDCFFRVTTDTVSFCTKTQYGDRNPAFNESFAIPCDSTPEGLPKMHVKVELFDAANGTARNALAYAEFWTESCTAQELLQLDLPLVVPDPALAAEFPSAVITLGIPGWILSYLRLKERMAAVEGVLCCDATMRLYVPLEPHVYLGIEYGSLSVDLKVCLDASAPPDLFPEVLQQFSLALQARRQLHPMGKELVRGLMISQEWQIENVPLSTDFRNWRALVSNCELVSETSSVAIKSILEECRQYASLAEVERSMAGASADAASSTLYIPVENVAPETVLLVKWQDQAVATDANVQVAVLDSAAASHTAVTVDIDPFAPKLMAAGWTTCTTFIMAPKHMCNGKYWVRRLWDVEHPDGVANPRFVIRRYTLSNTRQVVLADVLPLRPLQYPWPQP